MLTPVEKYQSTDLYRTLVSTKSITPQEKREEFKFIPNHTKAANTWDARHLDRFINSSWGTKNPSVLESRGLYTPRSGSLYDTDLKVSTMRSNKTQASTRLKSTLGATKEKEKAYVLNFSKDFTVKELKNNTNNLVNLSKQNQPSLESHYSKVFPTLDKTFKPEALEFSMQPDPFCTPKERREQLKAIRMNQQQMKEWKEKQKEITKKHRVYKSEFTSGILGLDNPLNNETLLYKEEHDRILKNQKKTKAIEERRYDQIKTCTMSHPMIEFFNKDFEKKTTLPPRQIVQRNQRRTVQMDHTKKWSNSGERLFAPVIQAHSPDRARYLQSQENKGRNWHILSFAKVDEYSSAGNANSALSSRNP